MAGMIAAGICGYGHTIRDAKDLLIMRNDAARCLRCAAMAERERDHIESTPLRELEKGWRRATIDRAQFLNWAS